MLRLKDNTCIPKQSCILMETIKSKYNFTTCENTGVLQRPTVGMGKVVGGLEEEGWVCPCVHTEFVTR